MKKLNEEEVRKVVEALQKSDVAIVITKNPDIIIANGDKNAILSLATAFMRVLYENNAINKEAVDRLPSLIKGTPIELLEILKEVITKKEK
jgi:hypothetical protein